MTSTVSDFRYPGNDYKEFCRLLGRMTDLDLTHVVIQPQQWLHSKCYGNVRLGQLKHYLELALFKPNGEMETSYRDFTFGIRDGSVQYRQEQASDLHKQAEAVAARIRELIKGAVVVVDTNTPREKQKE